MRPASESPDPHHLIVAFAHASDPACHAVLAQTPLPALQQLLRQWHPNARHAGDDYHLTPPHEHALGHALGGADPGDGRWPWAAWQAGRRGPACAWFTPCHWNAGREQVTLLPPDELDLRLDESQALLDALAPLAMEDGLALSLETPQRWRAEGDGLRDLPCASLDRVAHRRIDPWLSAPRTPAGRALQRLQNEAQMLFYTHPVNDARQARGALPINGFWASGAGVWDGAATGGLGDIERIDTLRAPALAGDWAAWGQAWQALDRERLAPWMAQATPAQPLRLTLCGERGWARWSSVAPTALQAHPNRPPSASTAAARLRAGWQRLRALYGPSTAAANNVASHLEPL